MNKQNNVDRHHRDHKRRKSIYEKDYFRMIINFILNEDKFRSKLLNLSTSKRSVSYEQAFPKRSKFEHFEYIGSGSYAQ
ncbi:hypothetical protein BLA29_013495, partial [Euroglyphus maynei]